MKNFFAEIILEMAQWVVGN